MGLCTIPGSIYWWSKLQKFVFKKILIFVKFRKCSTKYFKSANFFRYLFIFYKEKMLTAHSLSVRLYPMNVKTAEPIGPEFCVGPHVTQGKVYDWSKFQKFASIKSKVYEIFSWNPRNYFLYLFTMYTKRTCSQLK